MAVVRFKNVAVPPCEKNRLLSTKSPLHNPQIISFLAIFSYLPCSITRSCEDSLNFVNVTQINYYLKKWPTAIAYRMFHYLEFVDSKVTPTMFF